MHSYNQVLEIPEALTINTGEESPSRPRAISEMIDAVATPNTPNVSRKYIQMRINETSHNFECSDFAVTNNTLVTVI